MVAPVIPLARIALAAAAKKKAKRDLIRSGVIRAAGLTSAAASTKHALSEREKKKLRQRTANQKDR